MNIDKNLISQLKASGDFSEVHQVIGTGIFYCWRNSIRFRVEITDSGEENDNFRYMVLVFNPNGSQNSKSRGNGGPNILTAIRVVHWSNLEMDENHAKE